MDFVISFLGMQQPQSKPFEVELILFLPLPFLLLALDFQIVNAWPPFAIKGRE